MTNTMREARRWIWVVAALLGGTLLTAQPAPESRPLPYRFLLVINDQWKDPASEVVTEISEFSMLCALLKTWGLPFDIYRLDQQRLDAYHLLDRDGRPRHGTIIWNAPEAHLNPEAAELLRSLVKKQRVGLVAFSDTVATPMIAELAGLTPQGEYQSADELTLSGEHFVTRNVSPGEPASINVTKLLSNKWPAAATQPVRGTSVKNDGATVLARHGKHPALIARQIAGGGKVVWLDAERTTAQLYRQRIRDLLKRALVWVNGYALYAEYPRSVMLSMDDMGASDKTYFPGWHYRTPGEETIRTTLIEPLQRHHAVLTQHVVTGFLDRRTRRVLTPWRQSHVVDELDETIIHDFASTKRGLDAGVKAGVFEIQSHGWTHMSPDLDSPPGPFWSAPPRSAVVQLSWYKEFGDYVRKAEVPAIVQRLHLQRGLDCIAEDFGVRPISLICGDRYGSRSPPNNTMRLAAKQGFGFGQVENTFFLDHEACIPLEPVMPRVQWHFNDVLTGAEIPWTNDAPTLLGFHDRDVAMDAMSFAKLLGNLGPDRRYLSFAEYCAYLHSQIERDLTDGTAAPTLRIRYDENYCDFFRTHASNWVLHLSDETRAAIGRSSVERKVVSLPARLGAHTIQP